MSKTKLAGTADVGLADNEQPAREAHFEIVQEKKRGKVGRPAKLTEARFKRILEHIKDGITIVGSVRIENITYDCWRKQVRQNPEWQKLVDEAEVLREELWRSEALQTIRAAFPKHWVAAMTYLERRYPNEFALKVLNRNINTNEPLLDRVSPDQLAEDARLAREVAAERPLLG
jgi:hypothetical protein